MSYQIGLKVILRLCTNQSALAWHKAKLSPLLFKNDELPMFKWVDQHVTLHHALPKIETLEQAFPVFKGVEVPEPPSYYVRLLENKYFYERLNAANIASQDLLKEDKDANDQAIAALQDAINDCKYQKYRARIMDVGLEAPSVVLEAYHNVLKQEEVLEFGWGHMDKSGGIMPGEVVSIVGRPAMGKTWQMLYIAIYNWMKDRNTLLCSMEMSPLPMAQRVTSMYAHTNIGQLQTGGYSMFPAGGTYAKFVKGLQTLSNEKAKLYIVDGNLAASAEDVFILADQLKCKNVLIDGAYLLRHKNSRLDRFTRAAENVELMKRACTDSEASCFSSWQFNREASKKAKTSKGAGDLEDIGYTDAIGQISSIVLGLFQDDGVETMKQRKVRVLKGRNGQTGEFSINWNFSTMDFSQVQYDQPAPLSNL